MPIEGPRAAEGVARTMLIVAGVAAVVFLALSLGPIIQAADQLNPLYLFGAPVLVFGTPVVLAVAARRLTLAKIRWAQGAYAIMYLAVVLAWVPAMSSVPLPADTPPWPLEITALATVPAAIAWRPWAAWLYLVTNAALIAPIRIYTAGGADVATALQFGLFTLTFSAIFTGLALVAMKNGYTLDAATARARTAAAAAAASAARAQEQARLDALVHDEVMSTLFYASQGDARLDGSVRVQAARALAQLEGLRGGRTRSDEPVPVADFVARIRSVVLDTAGAFIFSTSGARSAVVPPDVASAFAEATSEAARNSIDHASVRGRAVQRSTTLLLADEHITVAIADDGAGFEPRTVPRHRLGILVSIRGRLAALPGAAATVESSPGGGTVVTLTWSDE